MIQPEPRTTSKTIAAVSALLLWAQSAPLLVQGSWAASEGASDTVKSALAESSKAESEKKSAESKLDNPGPAPVSKAKPEAKSKYVTEEPQLDPAGSKKRVHRPGQDTSFPPLAPPISKSGPIANPAPPPNPFPLFETPKAAAPKEKFPSVGQLEELMFGHPSPSINVENRLDKLETAIFQRTNADKDIEHRIAKLKEVVIGEDRGSAKANASPPYPPPYPGSGSFGEPLGSASPDILQPPTRSGEPQDANQNLPPLAFPNYGHFDMEQELSLEQAEKFGLVVLNEIRAQQGLDELKWDDLSYKVASEQIGDLKNRNAISHQNSKGHNPDLRYTYAGGSDNIVESAVLFPQAEYLKPTRQLVAKMVETLLSRQDDRQSLLFPHASGFSMAFNWTDKRQKILCLAEVVTKHGEMEPIPLEASVGERIEVKGALSHPYRFHKMTLAWEGQTGPPDDSAEQDEALPYFPPLDYEAHAIKSNRDFEKGVRILQIAGITAAIAGGMFIPPVALAAPLIAATVGSTTPKPVSEIKVKGGVKVNGANFSHRINLNNDGKDGIYYLTVWASTPNGDEIFPVSRRAIIAHKRSADNKDDKNEEWGSEKDQNPEKKDQIEKNERNEKHQTGDKAKNSDKAGKEKDENFEAVQKHEELKSDKQSRQEKENENN